MASLLLPLVQRVRPPLIGKVRPLGHVEKHHPTAICQKKRKRVVEKRWERDRASKRVEGYAVAARGRGERTRVAEKGSGVFCG
jgi:hypothetical protein